MHNEKKLLLIDVYLNKIQWKKHWYWTIEIYICKQNRRKKSAGKFQNPVMIVQMQVVSSNNSTLQGWPYVSARYKISNSSESNVCTFAKNIFVQSIDMDVVYDCIGQFFHKTSPSLCNRPKSSWGRAQFTRT